MTLFFLSYRKIHFTLTLILHLFRQWVYICLNTFEVVLNVCDLTHLDLSAPDHLISESTF